eukprot:7078640-Pyramimonas_sp.AAC.1
MSLLSRGRAKNPGSYQWRNRCEEWMPKDITRALDNERAVDPSSKWANGPPAGIPEVGVSKLERSELVAMLASSTKRGQTHLVQARQKRLGELDKGPRPQPPLET